MYFLLMLDLISNKRFFQGKIILQQHYLSAVMMCFFLFTSGMIFKRELSQEHSFSFCCCCSDSINVHSFKSRTKRRTSRVALHHYSPAFKYLIQSDFLLFKCLLSKDQKISFKKGFSVSRCDLRIL